MSRTFVGRDPTDFQGKLPPQNLQAERSVLGSILLQNNCLDEIADLLRADHFYSDAHQRMYEAILEMIERGVRVDAVTLAEELDKRRQLADLGGVPYVLEVLESVPHAAHVREYAEIVREKWIQRALSEVCTSVLKECYAGAEDTTGLLSKAERGIFDILESQDSNSAASMYDILQETIQRIDERTMQTGGISGLSTGFHDLDQQTNGFNTSELIILAARPSMGKTAFVCNLAANAARMNHTVAIFSLEQSRLELAERFLCIESKLDGHKLRKGILEAHDHHALMQTAEVVSTWPLAIDDKAGRTVSEIAAIIRRLKRRQNLRLAIIDYLQLIEPEDKRESREQQISQMTRRLKMIAKDCGIPMIVLSQLNRGLENRPDKRPKLADLRESGAIEQDADIVMFLHRPEAYDPMDRPGVVEVVVAKHRSGPTGVVQLKWRKECMLFEDYTAEVGVGFD